MSIQQLKALNIKCEQTKIFLKLIPDMNVKPKTPVVLIEYQIMWKISIPCTSDNNTNNNNNNNDDVCAMLNTLHR